MFFVDPPLFFDRDVVAVYLVKDYVHGLDCPFQAGSIRHVEVHFVLLDHSGAVDGFLDALLG